jgi:hypothetical protein
MSRPLAIQVRKEVRALLPWWAGVGATTTALWLLARQQPGYPVFGESELWVMMAYGLGILAVAALSVGHELTHNTLSSLLAQPISRLRVLATKFGVLIPAVVMLGIGGSLLFPDEPYIDQYKPVSSVTRSLLVWGPVMAGIGLVPLLTVLTRRPLGGVVFSIAIPGAILTVAERFYSLSESTLALTITWYGTLMACAIGLVVLWHRFQRLESVGEGGTVASGGWWMRAAVAGPAEAAGTRAVPRHWAWLAVMKELRLQQMTFAVSGLYLFGAGALLVSESLHQYGGPTFASLSVMHAFFVPLIAGALASAEERHLGTLAGHLLQPRNLRLQWAIKVTVTIGVALTLAIALPLVLMALHRPVDPFRSDFELAGGIAVLCTAAIFVSSFSSNSLWALLSCFPLMGAAIAIGGTGYRFWLYRVTYGSSLWLLGLGPRDHSYSIMNLVDEDPAMRQAVWKPLMAASNDISTSLRVIETSLLVAFGLLILYFAARNHRRLDRNLRTVSRQVLTMLLFAFTATAAYKVLETIAWRSLPF